MTMTLRSTLLLLKFLILMAEGAEGPAGPLLAALASAAAALLLFVSPYILGEEDSMSLTIID